MSRDYKIMGVWLNDTVLFCIYEALGSMSNTTKQKGKGKKGEEKRVKPDI